MTPIRQAYLVAAGSAVYVLDDPAVAAAWQKPSALTDFSVGGLAAHLAAQVLFVPATLAKPRPDGDPVGLLGHYERVAWIGADLDAEVNVNIRSGSEDASTDGAATVVAQTQAAVRDLTGLLAAEPDDRRVSPPAGPWVLTLDDFLVTRMMEIVVHSDDLAHSVGIPMPEFPAPVLDPVLDLLTRLAVRRHGTVPVLRALTRAERAPASITAF